MASGYLFSRVTDNSAQRDIGRGKETEKDRTIGTGFTFPHDGDTIKSFANELTLIARFSRARAVL